ncbi:retrotransposon protein, putative, ty1-copia subclass [Tanacetum coccineum]
MSQEFLDHLKEHGIIAHRTPPYTSQHNGVSERRNRTLLDMVRSMMSQTTLPKSFWDYALETAARILNMVPTKKVEKTPYEVWHGQAPKLSYLKVWGYPKETMGYSFYYPPENKVLVAQNAEFLENSLITQEASGSLEDLEIIQKEDTHPSIDTSLNHEEDDLEIDKPQSNIIPICRSTRTRNAPNRICLYINAEEHELGDLGEPANYKAALLEPKSDKWLDAMNVEMQSIKDKEVWDLFNLPPNGKTVGSNWLFKKKTDMDGDVHTYKARLMVKGYTQTPGIDYEETFYPIVDNRAIRILIAITAYYDYEIWQMDVKTAFLNRYLSNEVYLEQHEGFVNPKYPNQVCKLKRSIYGLKQASRQWNKRFDDEIKKFGFTQICDEPYVYLKASGSNVTFQILYVDDILIMGNNIPMLQDLKSYLGRYIPMIAKVAIGLLWGGVVWESDGFVVGNSRRGIPTLDPIREFAHYFDPNKPGAESDCDSEDMEEEVKYMINDKEVMSEQEESDHGYTQNIHHFEEKDDIDEWLNAEITKHMSMQGVENIKDALISIINNEVDRADDNTPNTAPCQLPMELSLGSFLLPFNINSHNLYATNTLDAKDNIMPQRVYEYLGLDILRDTSTFENTTGTNEPLGTVIILVKFIELEFPCNFIIKMAKDAIILRRPFLESTHAQINVFNEEISFEIGSKKFKFNIDSYQSIEKIYMVDIGQEEETFNPLEIGIDLFSYESPAYLEFEQRTRSYGTPNLHDEIAKPISYAPDRRGLVKRWHACKPVHVTYDDGNGEYCGIWLTCDLDSTFCFGYNEVFEVRYGQQKIDDTTRERRYYEWVAQNYKFSKHRTLTSTNLHDPILTPQGHQEQGNDEPRPIRPHPCNYSFEEWMKIRIGHNNLHESDREFIFNEWILDSYDVEEEYAREIGDPYSRRFDEYNRTFNNEIEHLSNKYILRIEKKGYVLDDVWEKCQQNYKKTNEAWHDEAYEEDEM